MSDYQNISNHAQESSRINTADRLLTIELVSPNDVVAEKKIFDFRAQSEDNLLANNLTQNKLSDFQFEKNILRRRKRNSTQKIENKQLTVEKIFKEKISKGIMPRNSIYFRKAQNETLRLARERTQIGNKSSQKYLESLKNFNQNFAFDLEENAIKNNLGRAETIIKNDVHFNELEKNHLSQKKSYIIIKSVASILSDFVQAMLALTSMVVYIMSTYIHNDNYDEVIHHTNKESEYDSLFIIELLITIVGTLDYFKELWEAKHKLRHLTKPSTLVDLVTIFPFYFSLIFDFVKRVGFLHIFQTFKVLRILRLWRLFRETSRGDREKDGTQSILDSRYSLIRQIGILCFSLFSAIFIGAGFFKEFDSIFTHSYQKLVVYRTESEFVSPSIVPSNSFQYFDGVYLMCQTLLTAGLGDIIPISISSRILLVCFIVVLFIVIYDQGGKIREIIKKLSPHDFTYTDNNHMIIMGNFDEYSVYKFLWEAYASYELREEMKKTLIIGLKEPSDLMLNLLNHSLFEGKVLYQVSGFTHDDLLGKGKIQAARAIFIFNNHVNVESMERVDGETMLFSKIIHDKIPFTRKIIQVNDWSNAKSLYKQLNCTPMTTVYSTRFVKTKIMASSIFAQGITTVFGNLLAGQQSTPAISHMNEILWYLEYGKSFKQEVFCVKFSRYFIGLEFQEVCEILYCSKSHKRSGQGVLLLGIKSFSFANEKGILYMNPYNYKIKPGDYGVVLAHDIETAEFLTFYAQEVDLVETGLIKKTKLKKKEIHFKALIQSFENTLGKEKNFSSEITDLHNLFTLWRDDLNEKIQNHIILICPFEYLELCVRTIRQKTLLPVVFLNDMPPSKVWERVALLFPNMIYCECNYFNIEQLHRSAIKDAFHVLIFANVNKSSISPDSNTLILVNTIDCFYDTPYTFELFEDNQLKFLGNRPREDLQKLPYHYWPKFISGKVFLSSLIDKMSSTLYLNDILIDILDNLFDEDDESYTNTSNTHQFLLNDFDINTYQNELKKKLELIEFSNDSGESANIFQNKNIYKIKIPHEYIGKTWMVLARDMLGLRPSVIPLALCTQRYTRAEESDGNTNCLLSEKLEATNSINKDQNGINSTTNLGGSRPPSRTSQSSTYEIKSLENKKYLDLGLIITNPLPTTIIHSEDEVIIFGAIVNRYLKKLNKCETESPNGEQDMVNTKKYMDKLISLNKIKKKKKNQT